MAMACLGSVTFLPLRPLLSVPFFISFISVSTFFEADGEYLRVDDFFAVLFFAALFFVAVVAMGNLLSGQMAHPVAKLYLTRDFQGQVQRSLRKKRQENRYFEAGIGAEFGAIFMPKRCRLANAQRGLRRSFCKAT